ncbi:hypothetical protein SAMN02745116_01574 [Pilibacter termitis]|uniref:YlaH-like protein n=1 Tax=Pilibacter termitis TaxID=263852 RepID=A0A1T4NXS5_9ENTE|nr:hypothetical protein [Pilibacter termitis]SJZ83847.1 hypothetical protein SAMN02745116_01574 [Pilibacter termitis]
MTYDIAIVSLITFVSALIYLEKGKLPQRFVKVALWKLLLIQLAFILLGLFLAVLIRLLYIPIIFTICAGCVILWRYRKTIDEWENKNV